MLSYGIHYFMKYEEITANIFVFNKDESYNNYLLLLRTKNQNIGIRQQLNKNLYSSSSKIIQNDQGSHCIR